MPGLSYSPAAMSQEHEGVYLPTSRANTFESTQLASAGWYAEGQHGGPLAALIVSRIEKVPTLTEMEIARVTIEIFRVIPLSPLTIDTEVIREGKRVQTVQARITGPDGTLLSIAVAQRLRVADRQLPAEAATEATPLPSPGESERNDAKAWGVGESGKTMFHRDAIEIREIHGGFSSIGPGAIWVRPTVPVIAGEDITPAQRAVMAADFCNGVSSRLEIDDWIYMNSDLSIHIGRYPTGEWVALDALSYYSDSGRGVAAGILWDQDLWVGRSAQTLFLDRNQRLSN